MIEEIEINGFRGIRSGRIKGFRRINFFVGPNNAGKSALMEALYLAGTAHRRAGLIVPKENREIETYSVRISGKDFLGCDPLLNVLGKHGYSGNKAAANRLEQGGIKVQIKARPPFLAAFDLEAGEDAPFSEQDAAVSVFAIDESGVSAGENRSEAYHEFVSKFTDANIRLPRNPHAFYCWHPDLTYFSKGTANWITSGPSGHGAHTLLFDADVARRHVSPDFYHRILGSIPGWTQRLAERFGTIFDLDPASFNVLFVPVQGKDQYIQGWIAFRDRPALPIDAFGDGARTAFKLLTPLTALAETAAPESPGLVLWEEPESFQNPASLSRLFHQVVDMIRDKPVQLFCATHSIEVVAHLTHLLTNETIPADDALLYQINLLDGELVSTWFDHDNLSSWLASGMDPRVWGNFFAPIRFSLREE